MESPFKNKFGMSIEEAVKAGPYSRSALYKVIAEGKLIARKAGRRTFIRPEDFEAHLEKLPIVKRTPGAIADEPVAA